MESNNLILGNIPNGGSGIRKTYEESNIVFFDNILPFVKTEVGKRNKLVYNKTTSTIEIIRNTTEVNDNYVELEIISILPYTVGNSVYYLVEVIDKKVLHRHLIEERMIIEEQMKERSL